MTIGLLKAYIQEYQNRIDYLKEKLTYNEDHVNHFVLKAEIFEIEMTIVRFNSLLEYVEKELK